jgi:hypothetical protein
MKSIWRRSLMVRGAIFPINPWPFRAMRCNCGQPRDKFGITSSNTFLTRFHFDNQNTETPKWGFSTCPKCFWPLRGRPFVDAQRMVLSGSIRYHFDLNSCQSVRSRSISVWSRFFSNVDHGDIEMATKSIPDRCERGIIYIVQRQYTIKKTHFDLK